MSSCGSCPSCSTGVPICVGNICVRPEEAVVSSGFLFAGCCCVVNFFVAQRDAVKARLSQTRRLAIFVLIPLILMGVAVQYGYIEVPTLDAVKNSLGLGNVTTAEDVTPGHGHAHGHAQWHGDHVGHFHGLAKGHLKNNPEL